MQRVDASQLATAKSLQRRRWEYKVQGLSRRRCWLCVTTCLWVCCLGTAVLAGARLAYCSGAVGAVRQLRSDDEKQNRGLQGVGGNALVA